MYEVYPKSFFYIFFFIDTATTELYTLSLHDALPIFGGAVRFYRHRDQRGLPGGSNLAPTVSFSPSIRAPVGCTATITTNGFPGLSSASVLGLNSTDFTSLQGAINDWLGIP